MKNNTVKTILKALAASAMTAAVLLFVFAFVAGKAEDPSKNLALFAYITVPVSVAVGGAVCSKGDEKTLCALLFSAVFVIIHILIGCVSGEIFKNPLFTLICYVTVVMIPFLIALKASSGGKKNNARKKYLRTR